MRHDDGIVDLAFSPRGTYLAATSADGCVRLWVIDPIEMIARVRQLSDRRLTDAEWQAYFPGLPRWQVAVRRDLALRR